MKLAIRTRNLELTAALRELVDRRVRFALTRLLSPDSRVSVTLADVNGPRGGCDKRVLVRATLPGWPEVVIQADDSNLAVALDTAVDRAARSCARLRSRGRPTGAARGAAA